MQQKFVLLPLSDGQAFSRHVSGGLWNPEVRRGLILQGPGVQVEGRRDGLHLPEALHREVLRLVLDGVVHLDSCPAKPRLSKFTNGCSRLKKNHLALVQLERGKTFFFYCFTRTR